MIQVIERGFDIIEFLAREGDRICTLSEIATTVGLNAGTCANIVKTLVARGYVEKVEGKVGYRIGPMFERLSGVNTLKNKLIEISRSELQKLTGKYDENTLLAILTGNIRQAILRINGTNRVQVVTIPEREAVHTATGKLLIAMQSDKQVKEYIKTYGYPSIHYQNELKETESVFFKGIEAIRKQGYIVNVGDRDVIGVAVPIYKYETVVASISMYMPSFRCTKALEKKILADLRKAGETISAKLSVT